MGGQHQIIWFLFLVSVAWSPNFGAWGQEQDVTTLKSFNIRKDKVTLSGFSSGSAMATTFHMAHSSYFSGVALFSMAYYRCGNGNLIQFGLGCSTWIQQTLPFIPNNAFGRYNISLAVQETRTYASRGLIDPLEGLANQKVFVWAGERDTLIPVDVAKQNYDFYHNFIPNTENLILTTHSAGHDFPTDDIGSDCKPPPLKDGNEEKARVSELFALGPRFANCNFSGAYEMMKFMIGDDIIKPDADTQVGELQRFNQSEFFSGRDLKHISMGEVGWIYVPEYCRDSANECLLHFHFHGCGGYDPNSARNTFIRSKFLHVAEENHVVMVFPLTRGSLVSLNGCWDFFAHSGPDYATKDGPQVKMLHGMLERLLESPVLEKDGATSAFSQFSVLGVGILSILHTVHRWFIS